MRGREEAWRIFCCLLLGLETGVREIGVISWSISSLVSHSDTSLSFPSLTSSEELRLSSLSRPSIWTIFDMSLVGLFTCVQ